ncbi:MAG: hypothetical protein RSC35_05470, partial [Mucinivorans sp.]
MTQLFIAIKCHAWWAYDKLALAEKAKFSRAVKKNEFLASRFRKTKFPIAVKKNEVLASRFRKTNFPRAVKKNEVFHKKFWVT